jgi:hypothetical protein
MARALAVAGVLGAGTALVFLAAFSAFAVLSSDRLTWAAPASTDVRIWVDRAPLIEPPLQDFGIRALPDRPWPGPVFPGPGVLTEPPVLIEPASPAPIDPTIAG